MLNLMPQANPILQQMAQGQNPGTNIMMQAVGAMLRGESPQTFLKGLAKTNPQLQGLDLDHPMETSEKIYKEKGEDIDSAKASFKDKIGQFIGGK